MTHYTVELRDGRHVGVTGLGDPSGKRLVLFCHPSPGAGGFDPDPPATATAGVRVITLDRPGYGASGLGPDSDSPVARWLDDVDEYLQTIKSEASEFAHTDFGSIGVVGWGLGAVYATGLAARHPELIDRVALIEPTGATRERVKASRSDNDIDARLETLDALDPFSGAADRLGLMLEAASNGTGGAQRDRQAIDDRSWADSLGSITARTMTVSSDGSDAKWYLRRIPGARNIGTWSTAATTIVEAWPTVLRFLTATR